MTDSDKPEGWTESAIIPETRITSEMNARLRTFREDGSDPDPAPVFPFKAQDALALDAIWFYERSCTRAGLHDQAEEVRKAIAEIEAWQERNPDRVKMPDHKHQSANRRNPHCNNCGDLRGGPFGHEASECTYDSKKG